jgi:glycosyltransferase involved in cell wall biosynthesis
LIYSDSMHRLRTADQHARKGQWAEALATLQDIQRDVPHSLIVHLRIREACVHLNDVVGRQAAERRIAEIRKSRNDLTVTPPPERRHGTLPAANLTIVDPVFRGSRLYYAAMLCEAAAAVAPGATLNLLTRRDFESDLFPSYRERLRTARLLPQLSVPEQMWYGRIPEVACRQIVDALVDAPAGSIFAFAGWNELLPTLAEQMALDGRKYPVHIVGYEYAANTLMDQSKQRWLLQMAGQVQSIGSWLLDEGFDTSSIALPRVELRTMPDPIPYRSDDAMLVCARGERSTFINTSRAEGCLSLLAVGLQSSRKGLRDLILAAREIETRQLPVRIFVSGKLADGEHELAQQVMALTTAMGSRIAYVDDAEILRTYNACDAVLLPYAIDFSGSSGVFAHAMAFGKPVIATEHGCVGWRTREFGVGLTYPAGDAGALIDVICKMLGWREDDWQAYSARCLAYYQRNSYEQALNAIGEQFLQLGLRRAVPAAMFAPTSRAGSSFIMSPTHPDQLAFPLDGAETIRQVCLLDTGIGSRNMGDHIIVDSIRRHLRDAFPRAIFVTVPTHEYLGTESLKLLDSSDIRLVCGTNLLASHMDEYKQWKIGGFEFATLRDLTLLGCGWWQYQEAPNPYTELLLNRILSDRTVHSVRDGYTAAKLKALGNKKVVNTTCPTLWSLTPQHLATIPEHVSQDVVTTLTDYKADADADRFMLEHLAARYRRVYVWIQGTGDFAYLKRLCAINPIASIRVVPASLEAYDELLDSALELDYVGTRLHAGVRALQRRRRALILAVDNRAREISTDTSLPCMPREQVRERLEDLIPSFSVRSIQLPTEAISGWISQFS